MHLHQPCGSAEHAFGGEPALAGRAEDVGATRLLTISTRIKLSTADKDTAAFAEACNHLIPESSQRNGEVSWHREGRLSRETEISAFAA